MTQRWTDEMLDKLSEDVSKISQDVGKLSGEVSRVSGEVSKVSGDVSKLSDSIKELRDESKELTIRLSAYQISTQQVVNLAFGLLATATITTIITAVLK